MKEATIEVGLFMTEYSSLTPEDLQGEDMNKIAGGAIISAIGVCPKNWTRIGSGSLTFTLNDREAVQKEMIGALNAQLAAHRAESHRIENQILGKIRDLQCLPAAVSA